MQVSIFSRDVQLCPHYHSGSQAEEFCVAPPALCLSAGLETPNGENQKIPGFYTRLSKSIEIVLWVQSW